MRVGAAAIVKRVEVARVGVVAGRVVDQDQGHPGLAVANLDQDISQDPVLDRDPDQDQGLDQDQDLDQDQSLDLKVGADQDPDLKAPVQDLVHQNTNLILQLGQDPDRVPGQGQALLVLESAPDQI